MWRSATLGLTGWLQDTQKIWKSVSSSPSLTFREKKSNVQDAVMCLQCLQQRKCHAGTMVMMISDLFVMLYDLLFGLSYDALQLVEAFFHFGESHASWLLLTADSLQKFLGLFFCDARALLPLLDTLGQDLVDSTGKTKRHKCSESNLIHTTLYWKLWSFSRFTWQRASCRSHQSSIWSWRVQLRHIRVLGIVWLLQFLGPLAARCVSPGRGASVWVCASETYSLLSYEWKQSLNLVSILSTMIYFKPKMTMRGLTLWILLYHIWYAHF